MQKLVKKNCEKEPIINFYALKVHQVITDLEEYPNEVHEGYIVTGSEFGVSRNKSQKDDSHVDVLRCTGHHKLNTYTQ